MNLDKALEVYEIDLQTKYKSLVRHQFDKLVDRFGVNLKNIFNSTSARVFNGLVRPNTTSVQTDKLSIHSKVYSIDEEKLETNSSLYAADAIVSIRNKILNKVGELENVDVIYGGAHSFLINGYRNGHKVYIEQLLIVKTSSKGTIFNQFPARIWVDKKFVSEAKYKTMFS